MHEINQIRKQNAWEVLGGYLERPGIFLTLLALTTLVLYSGALTFGFVWDDQSQIVNSPMLRSWSNLPRAFHSDLWYHVVRHQVYYRPLFVAWSMLNYTLFRLRPWGWHLGAILAHVAAIVAVFWLARRLRLEYWTVALTALIFALHPIHIEPVVWVSAASDTLVTAFVALAFVAFLNARDSEGKQGMAWRLGAMGLLGCALLTKEMAVTFPALVAIYAWLHPQQKRWHVQRVIGAVVETIPYAVVTAGYVLLRRHALQHATGQFDPDHGMIDVFRTLPSVVALYVQKLLLPVGLTGLYYTPYVTGALVRHVLIPAIALGAGLVGLWYWNRREENSTVAFATLWLLVGLAPALYLRTFGNGDFVRDRYIYLPSIGFAILLAMACRRLPSIGRWSSTGVQVTAVVVLCFAYVTASLAQQVYWGSELLIWTRGQSLYPDNPYTLLALASEYSQRGANERAIEYAELAFREHPENEYSRYALAKIYIRAGKFDQGRTWLQRGLLASPEYARSETGMATIASLYGRMGDFKAAFALCDQVLQKEPDLYSALYDCGNIYLMAGQFGQAQRLLSHAITIAPEEAAPKHYLGRALLDDGKLREAEAYLEAAVEIDPKVWDYHYWLAISLEQNHKIPAALVEYQEALRLNPDSSEAKMRLAELEGK